MSTTKQQTVVAKTLICLPDFAALVENHDRSRPVFVLWAETTEILHDPVPNFFTVFTLTAVSVGRDWDECVFLNLGHYKTTLQGAPIDPAEARRSEERARSAKEAVVGYLDALGVKVREGRPAMVDGLKLTAGDAEFLKLDQETGLYYFDGPKRARRGGGR